MITKLLDENRAKLQKEIEKSQYTVRVITPEGLKRTLCRGGNLVFSFSTAYSHATRYAKQNPGADYFIESVHPARPSFHKNALTYKSPF